jgi:integration host factor subunit beta
VKKEGVDGKPEVARIIPISTGEDTRMKKSDLSLKLSEKVNIPAYVAKVTVDAIFNAMMESLKKGDRIEIRGFGSFVVRHYGAYTGRNPKTGKMVDVPPKKLPYFKVGKELREMVNGEQANASKVNV